MTAPTVRTVLGDERQATRVYEDGSFECPFCHYPVQAPKTQCPNPACDTCPFWTPEKLQASRDREAAQAKQRRRDEATRAWSIQYAKDRAAAHDQWRSAQIQEARKRGACLECLFQAGWERVKFVRHRGECPTVRRRRSLYGQAAEAKRRGYP